MANLSDFDRAIKCNILRGDFKSAIDKIHDFYSQLEGRDQTVVFNALLRYYSKNEIIYSLTTKYRKNKIKDMPVVNKSDSSYSFNMFPGSEILMITPQPSSKSAGIQVFRNLTQVLRSSGLKVDELVYAKEQNLDVLFSKNKSKYDLVLIPETVSHIPKIYFQNILIYHGNKFAKLPQMQLGTLPVNPSKSINFVHSRSIDSSMKRLFLNTLNFEKFKPKSESRIGGTAIYLGKSEHELKIRSKLSLLSKKFETNLIITRNFPETEELPSFARELDLLITLDPISSTNLEFAFFMSLKITQKFPGVTIADIKKWNNIKGESLKPGMKLKING